MKQKEISVVVFLIVKCFFYGKAFTWSQSNQFLILSSRLADPGCFNLSVWVLVLFSLFIVALLDFIQRNININV